VIEWIVKHPLFKPNFDIKRFFDSFQIIQYLNYLIKKISMIHMPLKWHHINKCNKNYRKVDILTSILACLSSSASMHGLLCISKSFTCSNKKLFRNFSKTLSIWRNLKTWIMKLCKQFTKNSRLQFFLNCNNFVRLLETIWH